MNRNLTVITGAAAFLAVACFFSPGPSRAHDTRLEILHQAFAATSADPALAARLFDEAGRGAALESARLNSWFSCLLKMSATEQDWLSFLDADPPQDLTIRARARFAQATLDRGDILSGIKILEAQTGIETDLVLLNFPDPAAQQRAAHRLSVNAPGRLRRNSKKLEQAAMMTLTPAEKILRAESWIMAGSPSRAITELRREKFKGDDEIHRRLTVANAEIAAGNPSRVLKLLSSKRKAPVEEKILRARAHKTIAWQRFPRKSSRTSFVECLKIAVRIDDQTTDAAIRAEAQELVLECATEIASFDIAMTAWRNISIETASDRLPWLGRRLGVALAEAGQTGESLEIARQLPAHARCLDYWISASTMTGTGHLTQATINDLYGSWARSQSTITPEPFQPVKPITKAPLPPTVQWLVDRGHPVEARREFRALRRSRTTTGNETLTAAVFEAGQGRHNTSIRVLRSGFPELGSVDIIEAPINVIHHYLPLRWEHELIMAADEAGIDPWLLAGLARQESLFTAHARSHRGAIGVLQLIPSTARLHARRLGIGTDLLNPAINLRLGAQEIASLIDDFGAIEPSLAAYNAGRSRVKRWWKRTPDARQFTESVPIPETYTYIRRVVFLSEAYRHVYEEKWEKP